jgi:hypothetical protein
MSSPNEAKKLLRLLFLFLLFPAGGHAQASGQGSREQSSFGTEEVPGIPLVKRPVPVPNTVLQLLAGDVDVKGCLSDNPLPANHSLASLFIGSEIHLDGPSRSDLIVVPVPGNGCFQGATGIGSFWVFRRAGKQYELALKALGNGLTVLKTRYDGYRIIQTGTLGQAGRYLTTITFRFDGKQYTKVGEITQQR